MTHNARLTSKSTAFAALVTLAVAAVGTSASAAPCTGQVHVRQSVSVDKPATCVLSKLFEPQRFCLSGADGKDLAGVPFDVVPGVPAAFGMTFYDGADFNMEYGVTCVAKDGGLAKSPKVIFTIGAAGPGTPVVSLIERDGGQGTWAAGGDLIELSARF